MARANVLGQRSPGIDRPVRVCGSLMAKPFNEFRQPGSDQPATVAVVRKSHCRRRFFSSPVRCRFFAQSIALHVHRNAPNQDATWTSIDIVWDGHMKWLLAWLIVNALFFVWRILVTSEIDTRDRSGQREGTRNSGFSANLRRRHRL